MDLADAQGVNSSVLSRPLQTGVQEADSERRHRKLAKAAQDFEAVFVGTMLKQMRKSIAGDNPLFGGSQEAKMYQDMMDDATAQQMSRSGSFGFAKLLVKTLEPQQSGSEAALEMEDQNDDEA